MGRAIGQILPFAVGVAISPLPIVAVVLMLVTPRARINGPVFVAGWLVGLAVIGVIVLGVIGPTDTTDAGEPATWVNILKLVLGALLVVVAVRQWRGRPHAGDDAVTPKWMGTIDQFGPGKALLTGVVLSAANPKNLLLSVGAATAIAQTQIAGRDQAIAYAVFALIATIGVGLPVVLFFTLGARSREMLDHLKAWMIEHNAAIMAVLCVIIGVKLIGDAISGFAA
jgi:threonine/homoserine/homoserine lactone efflux protein